MLYISPGLLWVIFANKISMDGLDNPQVTLPQKWFASLVHQQCFLKLSAMRIYYRKDGMTVTGIPSPVNQTLPWTFLCSLGEYKAVVEACSRVFFIGFLMNWIRRVSTLASKPKPSFQILSFHFAVLETHSKIKELIIIYRLCPAFPCQLQLATSGRARG